MRRLTAAGVEVLRSAIRGSLEDDLPGQSAKMAYFFFLSLFPGTLIVFALTGFVGGDAAFTRIAAAVRAAMPADAWALVETFLAEIMSRERRNMISIGAVILVWAASSGIAAFTDALNTIFDTPEGRGWFERRAIGLAVIVAAALFLVGGAAMVLVGVPALAQVGLDDEWRIARYPIGVLLIMGIIWAAYGQLPSRDDSGLARETLVGAGVATLLWVAVTAGFSFYMSNIRDYGQIYGAVGAVVALLIWCYLTALAVLFGGELAAALERRRRGGPRRPREEE